MSSIHGKSPFKEYRDASNINGNFTSHRKKQERSDSKNKLTTVFEKVVKTKDDTIPIRGYDPERDKKLQRAKEVYQRIENHLGRREESEIKNAAEPDDPEAKTFVMKFIELYGDKEPFSKLGLSEETDYKKIRSFLEKAGVSNGKSEKLQAYIEKLVLQDSASALKRLEPFQNSLLVQEIKQNLWNYYSNKLSEDRFYETIIGHISKKCSSGEQKFNKLMNYGFNHKNKSIDIGKFSRAFAEEIFNVLQIDMLYMEGMTGKIFTAICDGMYKKAEIAKKTVEEEKLKIVPEFEDFKALLRYSLETSINIEDVLNSLQPLQY